MLTRLVEGHPFQDGNKRTAFFLANAYMRMMGYPGLGYENGHQGMDAAAIAERHIGVAAGQLGVEELAGENHR